MPETPNTFNVLQKLVDTVNYEYVKLDEVRTQLVGMRRLYIYGGLAIVFVCLVFGSIMWYSWNSSMNEKIQELTKIHTELNAANKKLDENLRVVVSEHEKLAEGLKRENVGLREKLDALGEQSTRIRRDLKTLEEQQRTRVQEVDAEHGRLVEVAEDVKRGEVAPELIAKAVNAMAAHTNYDVFRLEVLENERLRYGTDEDGALAIHAAFGEVLKLRFEKNKSDLLAHEVRVMEERVGSLERYNENLNRYAGSLERVNVDQSKLISGLQNENGNLEELVKSYKKERRRAKILQGGAIVGGVVVGAILIARD